VPDTTTQQPLLVTVEEAGRMIGVSRWKAYQLVRTGVLPVVRLGPRSTRVPVDALKERMSQMVTVEEGRTA